MTTRIILQPVAAMTTHYDTEVVYVIPIGATPHSSGPPSCTVGGTHNSPVLAPETPKSPFSSSSSSSSLSPLIVQSILEGDSELEDAVYACNHITKTSVPTRYSSHLLARKPGDTSWRMRLFGDAIRDVPLKPTTSNELLSSHWTHSNPASLWNMKQTDPPLGDTALAPCPSLQALKPAELTVIEISNLSVALMVPSARDFVATGGASSVPSDCGFKGRKKRWLSSKVQKASLCNQSFGLALFGTGGGRVKETRVILNSLTATFSSGRLIAVMGPSGSGKSTLLNVLSGRIRHTQGSLKVSGAQQYSGPPCASALGMTQTLLRRHTAFIQQVDLFLPNLTVAEHLDTQLQLRLPGGGEPATRRRIVDAVLNRFGLSKARDVPIGAPDLNYGISGGERKRLSVATATLSNPYVVLADEPTTGLDTGMAASVMATLRRLASSGRTVIASLHQPSTSLFAMCDEVLLLAEGRIIYFGDRLGSIEWMRGLGLHCPKLANPSDFLIWCVSIPEDPAERQQKLEVLGHWADAWAREGHTFTEEWHQRGRLAFYHSSQSFAERSIDAALQSAWGGRQSRPVSHDGSLMSVWDNSTTNDFAEDALMPYLDMLPGGLDEEYSASMVQRFSSGLSESLDENNAGRGGTPKLIHDSELKSIVVDRGSTGFNAAQAENKKETKPPAKRYFSARNSDFDQTHSDQERSNSANASASWCRSGAISSSLEVLRAPRIVGRQTAASHPRSAPTWHSSPAIVKSRKWTRGQNEKENREGYEAFCITTSRLPCSLPRHSTAPSSVDFDLVRERLRMRTTQALLDAFRFSGHQERSLSRDATLDPPRSFLESRSGSAAQSSLQNAMPSSLVSASNVPWDLASLGEGLPMQTHLTMNSVTYPALETNTGEVKRADRKPNQVEPVGESMTAVEPDRHDLWSRLSRCGFRGFIVPDRKSPTAQEISGHAEPNGVGVFDSRVGQTEKYSNSTAYSIPLEGDTHEDIGNELHEALQKELRNGLDHQTKRAATEPAERNRFTRWYNTATSHFCRVFCARRRIPSNARTKHRSSTRSKLAFQKSPKGACYGPISPRNPKEARARQKTFLGLQGDKEDSENRERLSVASSIIKTTPSYGALQTDEATTKQRNTDSPEDTETDKDPTRESQTDSITAMTLGDSDLSAPDGMLLWECQHKSHGFWLQLRILTRRALMSNKRDPILLYARGFQTLIIALVYGSLFFNLGNSPMDSKSKVSAVFFVLTNQGLVGAAGVCSTFPSEKVVINRERECGLVDIRAYLLAKMLADIPIQCIFPVIFNLITVFMMNLCSGWDRILLSCLVSLTVCNCAITVGYLGSASASSSDMALVIAQLWVLPALLFCGFVIKLEDIPRFISWMQYLSYFRYGFIGFSHLVFHKVPVEVLGPPKLSVEGDLFVKRYLGIDIGGPSYFWLQIGILTAMIIACRALTICLIVPMSKYWKEKKG